MMSPDVALALRFIDVGDAKVFVLNGNDMAPDTKHAEEFIASGCKLPFSNTALVFVTPNNNHAVFAIAPREHGGVLISGATFNFKELYVAGQFNMTVMPDTSFEVKPIDKAITLEIAASYATFIFDTLNKINAHGGVAYVSTPNPSNARRKAKGKRPLFTWTTVNLDAPRYISEPKGGTHASPRLHDRRGHWVTSKLGKRFWRKDAKVGSAKNGIAFQTYQKGIESDE
jgi:hypothetical protein